MATSKSDPLSDFTTLGPSILLYLPSSTAPHNTSATVPPPSLIILTTWNSALSKHIAKYTAHYRTLYPSSPILVVRNTIPDLITRSYASQEKRLKAAISVIQEYGTGKVLLHAFSNGGAFTATQLARVYKLEMGQELSVGALVLDSSPGIATLKRTADALVATLPKGFLYVYSFHFQILYPFLRNNVELIRYRWHNPLVLLVLYLILGIVYIHAAIFHSEDVITVTRNNLNNGTLIHENIRLYAYSVQDPMVGWEDVEAHSREAEKNGCVVRKEKWDTSGHCGHMYNDPKRYWDAVQQVWEASSK